MPANPAQFERQLSQGELAAVYLIAGSEDLLRIEACDAVRRRARALGFAEREVHDVEAGFSWSDVVAGFGAMSLFAQRRVIELRLPTGKPGKEGAAVIEQYCANPPPDLCLLISAGEWSRQHETAWVKTVERSGVFLPLWPMKPNELPGWIARRLQSRGVEATQDAIAILVERVEGNLLAAAQEVDKLALLAHGQRLDATRMESLVADSARYDVFRLAEAALQGDAARALRMLRGLRAEGEQVPPLLSWIAAQVQVLARLSAAQERGANMAQAMQQAGVWESRQPLFKRALSRGSAAAFDRMVALCARIERSSKGRGDGDPWQQLERLLVAIAEPRATRPLLAG